MPANGPESGAPPPGSLQAMLARLRGMMQALKSTETLRSDQGEFLPTWDVVSETPAVAEGTAVEGSEKPPVAMPVPPEAETTTDDGSDQRPASDATAHRDSPVPSSPPQAETGAAERSVPVEDAASEPAFPQVCSQCSTPRQAGQAYCDNCGWIFPSPYPQARWWDNQAGRAATTPAIAEAEETGRPRHRLQGRYELGQPLGSKGTVERFRGLDFPSPDHPPVPVMVLRAPAPSLPEIVSTAEVVPEATVQSEELSTATCPVASEQPPLTLPSPPCREGGEGSVTGVRQNQPRPWPSLSWEQALLVATAHPALPGILAHFTEAEFEYLVEELPQGRVLWDAWDDPEATTQQRFGWLRQIAEVFQHLHQHGAILEGLRPDIVIVDPAGLARLTDLSDLLPLPLPPDPPIRATCYTAPELVLQSEQADARADLYSFGAMVHALHLGRELTELDFELQGLPKSILHRFPDIHPLFGRLVSKTFCRELSQRFPSEEAAALDPTGFKELIDTLDICARTLDQVRLGIAAWTTTGMVRTGNEDAFAVLSASAGHESCLSDCALVLLADGMGGTEAGEIAAALAIETMRGYLLQQEAFAPLAGKSPGSTPARRACEGPSVNEPGQDQTPMAPAPDVYETLLVAALKEANQKVYAAAKSDAQKSGMGCTAEAVYLCGRQVVVAHVGDSRTYHFHHGQLVQLTRDQTWVNRMVDLGVLAAEEAESHPRRSELQQAIGGYPDVEPAVYQRPLQPGDWVVVCSDGISNQLPNEVLQEVLQTSTSPEAAARRLVNLVNLHGATDNATVVVIRAS